MYQEGLGPVKQLVLPPPPVASGDHFDIFQNYEIECEKRNELKKYLADHGVGTLIQWGGVAVHQQPGLGFKDVKLPGAERIMANSIMIPINMFVSDEDVHHVIDTIRNFYGVGAH